MNRAEHLQWAKDRALAYLNPPQVIAVEGSRDGAIHTTSDGRRIAHWPPQVTPQQLSDACASFLSDIAKHPDIDPSAANMVFAMEAFSGGMNSEQKVRDFINGTN